MNGIFLKRTEGHLVPTTDTYILPAYNKDDKIVEILDDLNDKKEPFYQLTKRLHEELTKQFPGKNIKIENLIIHISELI